MSQTSTLKIAIVGAGPAGCTLGRLLLNEPGIEVSIFEGETDRSVRTQGGTLDLHEETGQKAIRKAELYEEFRKSARYDGEALAVVDKTKFAVFKLAGSNANSSRGRPEIDRSELRRILLDSLPEGTIHWGKRLQIVDLKDLSLHFSDGIEKGFDLLIGADGAWSKVRPVVSPVEPQFAGLGGVDLVIKKAAEHHPNIDKLVNRGSTFAINDGKGLILQQKGDDSLSMYAWSVKDEQWRKNCGYDVNDFKEVQNNLLEEFADWDPVFKEAIQSADNREFVTRNLYVLPIGHEWEPRAGVTLIGDAAHLMTPFAGEGVNLAMEDALKLSNAIISAKKKGANAEDFNKSIRSFELEMFRRAASVAEVSYLNMKDLFYNPEAPQAVIAPFVRRSLSNGWLIKLLLPLWFVKLLLRWIFWW